MLRAITQLRKTDLRTLFDLHIRARGEPVTDVSAAQTVTTAGSLTLAHGLGEAPKLIMVFLTCLTAEAGYAVGDIFLMNPQLTGGSAGITCMFDATNLTVRFANVTAVLNAHHKTTGTNTVLTNANWSITFRAFA